MKNRLLFFLLALFSATAKAVTPAQSALYYQVVFPTDGHIINVLFGIDSNRQYNLVMQTGTSVGDQNYILSLPQFNNFGYSGIQPIVTLGNVIDPGAIPGISPGTINTIPKYTAARTIGNSLLTDNGTTLNYTGTGGININLARTTGPTAGVIRQLSLPLLHTYNTDGFGQNIFLGGSGNFSLTTGCNTNIGIGGKDTINNATTNLAAISTGSENIAIGSGDLGSATIANQNVIVGHASAELLTTGGFNAGLGPNSFIALTTGTDNVAVGSSACQGITTGVGNIGIGTNTLQSLAAVGNQDQNIAVGFSAGTSLTGGQLNSFFGANSGANFTFTTGNGNLGLGAFAGSYLTGSNELWIDNQNRTSLALEKTNSLVWGIFAAAPADQKFRINAVIEAPNSIVRVAADFTNATTTLNPVTGLTVKVLAAGTYRFRAKLYTTSNVAGGVNFSVGGTATATSIVYEGRTFSGTALVAQTRAASLGTSVGAITAVTAATADIEGTIVVNAAGTLVINAAANVAVGTTTILSGSTFEVMGSN